MECWPVRPGREAINKHDPAAVAALCTPAGTVTTPVGLFSGHTSRGKEVFLP